MGRLHPPLLIVSVVLPALLAEGRAADFPAFSLPEQGICARGGAADTCPENTLKALRAAIQLGVHMVELDVGQTADGHTVLMRDETVGRTTNGTGRLSGMTLRQLRRLDAGGWKHKRHSGEVVPTLQEALAAMPENIWIRLKVQAVASLSTEVARTIVETGRQHQCIILCDDPQTIRQTWPQLRVRMAAPHRIPNDHVSTTTQLEARLRTDRFLVTSNPTALMVLADKLQFERVTPVYRARTAHDKAALPTFPDGQAQVIPAFKDEKLWIHHDLWVETEFDSDGDGKPDRMHVSVTRQRQTDTQQLKVPVVYISSPYFSGTASGRYFFWDPRHELNETPPPHADAPDIKQQHRRVVLSKSHTQDWVPRGFAVVHSASPGTGLSQGCPTIGGDNESLAPKAVIDWLCGRAKGYTMPRNGKPVTAYWSTGKVGMTGTSFNGTIALAAATTGVPGLEAIIPVAPNTSYYHYYRSNGLVRHPSGYVGEDVDVLYDYVNSGDPDRRDYCDSHVRDTEILQNTARTTGDYNEFWARRDYLNDLEPFRAALLMSHAFNDWNVMPEHGVRIYRAVQAKGIPAQCYFHQGGHGGPPPLAMMNRWFSRYLYGVDNGVENDPKAWIVREGQDPESPVAYEDYPHPRAEYVTLRPVRGGSRRGGLVTTLQGSQGAEALTDDVSVSGKSLAQAETSKNRLIYVTARLRQPLHVSGTCRLKLRLACTKPACNLSCWLVALPWKSGRGTKIYDNVITRGWADPQNHKSISDGEPLVPGRSYDVSFDLQPDDQIIPIGKRIGLMIFSSDRDHTVWPEPGTQITVDLDETAFEIPVVGGRRAFENATTSPPN